MAFLGQLLQRYFDLFSSRPLTAYGWNIAGSLAGTVLYSLLAAFSTPPEVWFGICILLFGAICVLEMQELGWQVTCAAVVLSTIVLGLRIGVHQSGEIWTPYYKVQMYEMAYQSGQATGHGLRVNNTWFQRSFDMQYLGRPEETEEDAHAARNLRFLAALTASKPKKVLVLGSGLGNDTAAALRFGAEHIDAVDIDAGIVNLSEQFHPNKPYRDSRVTVHIDDARHYLSYSSETYDLVLLGVLEARSLFSQFSNLRLDNYVYTLEGIKAARARLNPGGIVWVNMWVPRPWLLDKLEAVMQDVFDDRYAVFHGVGSEHYSLVGGPSLNPAQLREVVTAIPAVEPVTPSRLSMAGVTMPIDDWPYIFYRTRQIPLSYLGMLTLLVVLSVVPLRLARRDLFHVRWPFFFLGAAFLLVEASAVVRMALIAGTTWTVNSCVFAGVLCFAFLSNWIVARWSITNLSYVFAALAAALVGSYAFPFDRVLAFPPVVATVLAATVLTLPVLFSGIVFSALLQNEPEPSRALASNLFGAIFGGFAEYLSMLAGNRAMALLALCLYLAAYWFVSRRRVVWAMNLKPALNR